MNRVLVIDDDPVIGTLARALLAREGIEVEVAADGEAGLAAARAAAPALVLVDSNLPGMSGAEVIAALRADGATATVPILMMSADASAPAGSGADGSLPKPFAPPDLVAAVRRFLSA